MAIKKLESNLVNMVGVLTIITLIAAATLGYVYNLTKDKIAFAQEQKKLKAIEAVILPGYDNAPSSDVFTIKALDLNQELECYPAKYGDEITSFAIKTVTMNGFCGDIWLMAGFLPNGTIHKISVVSQKETPGLGTKIAAPKFLSQFEGKDPTTFKLKVKQDGGDIDAITAATISSRAFCDAMTRAYEAYKKHNESK